MRPTGVTNRKSGKKGLVVTGAEWGSAASGGTEPAPEVRMSDVSIPEDAAIGDLVGLLSVQNPVGSYTFTMTSSAGGKFALDGVDDTRVEVAGALDYETATSHSITIEADNGVDPVLVQIFNISVTDVFEAAAEIVLTGSTIAENASVGDLVGTLSVINGSGTYAFTMTDTAGGKFALDGGDDTLVEVAGALDFETATSHDVDIEADNGVDTPITDTFTITVTDVAEGGGDVGSPMGLLLALTKAS